MDFSVPPRFSSPLAGLAKGPLDPATVVEGNLWNRILEGEYKVTTREPARRYRVVGANCSVDRGYHFYSTVVCQVLR